MRHPQEGDCVMSEVSPGKLTRQQLYDKIRQSSKEEYILEEMKRLGFWENTDKPSVSEELIKERAKLRKELSKLLRSKRLLKDPEQALELMHKERKKQAKENRKKTKIERIKNAYQRALNWYNLNKEKITYLGESSKIELSESESNQERLSAQSLPLFNEPASLAKKMGISLSELRFLTFNRQVSKISHYKRFSLAKKSGGVREISAPMPRLKRAQYWVKVNLLDKIGLSEAAHGFVPERSIVSNAVPHVGQSVVINMDLKDFFPTITYKRVKGMFQQLGYSEEISILLALLTTEPKIDELTMDGETYYVANGERLLPQGAPTSPVIANIICRKLDRRINDCAQKLGFKFTRYADDLTFSSDSKDSDLVQKLLWRVKQIIQDEGFNIHPKKTRIMRAHQTQEVTGIIVNEKVNLSRKKVKRLRAVLFQIEKDGFSNKHWEESDDILRSLIGFVNYYAMVNPEKALAYKAQLGRIVEKYNPEFAKDSFIGKLKKSSFIEKSAAGEQVWDNWWEPKIKEAPKLVLPKEKAKKKTDDQTTSSTSSSREVVEGLLEREPGESNQTEIVGKVFTTIALLMFAIAIGKSVPALLVIIAFFIYKTWK